MPMSIDVDNNGQIYILDASRCDVQVFDSSGNFISKFGSKGSGDNQFSSPGGIAIDDGGNIYISIPGIAVFRSMIVKGTFCTNSAATDST